MGNFHFQCINCNAEYSAEKVIYLCPACSAEDKPGNPPKGILKAIYPYREIMANSSPRALFADLYKESFLSLLPVNGFDSWPSLRVGDTPLYKFVMQAGGSDKRTSGQADGTSGQADERTGGQADRRTKQADKRTGRQNKRTSGQADEFDVYLKDDSQNPTFSFKDRASALVSAWAKENGIDTLVAASTGNAGSSLAGICANQGQKAIIVVPATAPPAKLTQILMYGAILVPVKGNYDAAFDLSIRISEKYGFYNRNTAFNPLTIEGKKTVAFEIFGQLGQQIPERIFIPVGDGVIFSGVAKGFEDLLELGIIDRMPTLVAVQAAGSANLVNNIGNETFIGKPSSTVADSISVDIPRCFHMAKSFVVKHHFESAVVSDEEILDASLRLSQGTGIFAEPAAAAAFAGMLKYRELGMIPAGSKNVVLLTGSGLKDPGAVKSYIQVPEPVEPEIESVDNLIKRYFK